MNRKNKRLAKKAGLPPIVTFENLVTKTECSALVVWDENFTPTLTFVDDNKVVYQVAALDFMEATTKLMREALDRFKESMKGAK